MNTEQPEALRLAEYWERRAQDLQKWVDEDDYVEFGYRPEGLKQEQADQRKTAAELRRLHAENQGQAERIQDIYKQLNDTEKEVDDLRAELHEEAKINGACAERELRLMAELDKVKRITLRDEALLRLAYLAIDKMLPSAFCDEGVEALRQLKERLK